jgi:predicted glycoside hydrolase/deacetylase ChbG (UPF0249 family)
MVAGRYLIVNADDFGQSYGVSQGIIEAHEHGIVTSASLMVRWPAASAAAAYAQKHSTFSLGLHFDFAEWTYRDATWVCQYEVVRGDDPQAVAEEIARQLAAFRLLVGRDPTHLDSHQHAHREEPFRSALIQLARELAIPVRHFSPDIRYCGNFYGQTGTGAPIPEAISVDHLTETLEGLAPGLTELGCHPGYGHDLQSMYCRERAWEVKTLCDPRVRQVLSAERIELRSFSQLTGS